MRVLALDLGSRRIGVAVSDPSGTIASPHAVLERTGDTRRDHRAVADLVAETGAEVVVVGLPLSMTGERGPAARAAAAEITELAAVLPVPVVTHDERLTTISAERSLRGAGVRGARRRERVDKVAAAVILQAWLDGPGRQAPGAGSA